MCSCDLQENAFSVRAYPTARTSEEVVVMASRSDWMPEVDRAPVDPYSMAAAERLLSREGFSPEDIALARSRGRDAPRMRIRRAIARKLSSLLWSPTEIGPVISRDRTSVTNLLWPKGKERS